MLFTYTHSHFYERQYKNFTGDDDAAKEEENIFIS
jgi:hypothetical protein